MDNFLGHNFSVFQILLKIFHIGNILEKIMKFQIFQTLSHKNAIKKVEGVKNWQKFCQKWAKNGRNLAKKVAILANFGAPNGEKAPKKSGNTANDLDEYF